jgi:cytosine/adenosine deaminase-related metal-dependent hydrolase
MSKAVVRYLWLDVEDGAVSIADADGQIEVGLGIVPSTVTDPDDQMDRAEEMAEKAGWMIHDDWEANGDGYYCEVVSS